MDNSYEQTLGLGRAALDRARLSRDARFDGRFFIAVLTTRIYCRSICPAPHSKPANVIYFPTAAAAALAGFRPCKRCRPEAAPGTPAWVGTSEVVRCALRMIEDGALDDGSMDAFARRIGVGARQLDRLFAQHVGAAPLAIAQTRRLHFARRLLDETALPITQIALASGFGSVRRFNDAFKAAYRSAPRDVRRRRGEPSSAEESIVLRLAYRPPYDWHGTLRHLAERAVEGVETVTELEYRRVVHVDGGTALISVRHLECARALQLVICGAPPSDLLQVATNARRVFDLDADPLSINSALAADTLLEPLVRRNPGLRIPGSWCLFEGLARSTLSHGLSVTRSRDVMRQFARHFGLRPSAARRDDAPFLAFPSAEGFLSADTRGLDLDPAPLARLRGLAQMIGDRRLDSRAPIEVVRKTIGEAPGMDERVRENIALFVLADPDAFPTPDDDATEWPPTSRENLVRRSARWRPWRGYAALHLQRAEYVRPLDWWQDAARMLSVEGTHAGSDFAKLRPPTVGVMPGRSPPAPQPTRGPTSKLP